MGWLTVFILVAIGSGAALTAATLGVVTVTRRRRSSIVRASRIPRFTARGLLWIVVQMAAWACLIAFAHREGQAYGIILEAFTVTAVLLYGGAFLAAHHAARGPRRSE